MRLGCFNLEIVSDGGFRLDGGAMFGVVPKTLWSKQKPADERNRIGMGTNCLLLERGGDLVLVDTGLGDKHDAKFEEIYGYEAGARRLPDSIRAAGFELGDVTHVVLSHLHFDHSGWNTRANGTGLAATFPRARYWLERGEVEHARRPNERDRASYDERNWEPLFSAGVVEVFDGEASPIDGVRAIKAPGHNRDMCVVTVDGGDPQTRAIFFADLVPTSAHVPAPWVMGYDLYPLTTMEQKHLWLPRVAAENWLCVFEHDPEVPLGRLVEEKPGRYRAQAV